MPGTKPSLSFDPVARVKKTRDLRWNAAPLLKPRVRQKHEPQCRWVRSDNPLWGPTGPKASDGRQGEIGSCWLEATALALADQRPAVIESMFRENDDGTVTVRFFDYGGQPFYVRVDRTFPKGPYWNYTRTEPYIWVALIEKAYAAWKGSYEEIENGSTVNAICLLSGRTARTYREGDLSINEVLRCIDSERKKTSAVALLSTHKDSAPNGLLPKRAYSMLQKNNAEELPARLRDPHGGPSIFSEPPIPSSWDSVSRIVLEVPRKQNLRRRTQGVQNKIDEQPRSLPKSQPRLKSKSPINRIHYSEQERALLDAWQSYEAPPDVEPISMPTILPSQEDTLLEMWRAFDADNR